MAEPIVPLERAILTGRGFINDVIANLIEIVSKAFNDDPNLKPYAPQRYFAASPNKKMLEGTPTLHIWCPRTLPQRNSIGGATGDKKSTHFQHFINIEYVYLDPDSDDSDIVVNEVAAALFDIVNQHVNVNGLTSGDNQVFEILVGDSFYAVLDEVKLLNKCTIHAVYNRSYKRPTATR